MGLKLPGWLQRLLCRLFGLYCANRGDFRVQLGFVTLSPVKFMGFDFLKEHPMSASLTLSLDDTGQHSAVLNCTNTQDGSIATGVTITYSGDNDSVATVAPDTGALRLVAVGTVNITGSGVRGAFSHSDSGVLTVTPGDPNKGDFSASLGLS